MRRKRNRSKPEPKPNLTITLMITRLLEINTECHGKNYSSVMTANHCVIYDTMITHFSYKFLLVLGSWYFSSSLDQAAISKLGKITSTFNDQRESPVHFVCLTEPIDLPYQHPREKKHPHQHTWNHSGEIHL